jgi:hypothetical protein
LWECQEWYWEPPSKDKFQKIFNDGSLSCYPPIWMMNGYKW